MSARRRSARAAGLAWAWLLALSACSGASAPPARPNFVIVLIDTLRADRLHYAGYWKKQSPSFDEIQRQSAWFPHAYSTSSWTIPSVASLFVSQLASQHRVVLWGSPLPGEDTTFVEVLRDHGYRTGGFTANRLMAPSRGFAQGFDAYKLVLHPFMRPDTKPGTERAIAPARAVTRKALQWLEEAAGSDRPFLLYIHYMEPHTPYLCADGAGDACRVGAAVLNRRILSGQWKFDERDHSLIESLYDADVERMDAALGELWSRLDQLGALENTWVVVTADHGEQLGERGWYVHGKTLFQPLIRIPLLISPPSREGSIVELPVSLVDLAPTLLELAGVEVPASFVGRSLVGALDGSPPPSRPVVAELFPLSREPDPQYRHRLAVVDATQSLVLGVDGSVAHFDLTQDPVQTDSDEAAPEALGELLAKAGVVVDLTAELDAGDATVSPEMLEHLKALGYVH